MNESESKPNQPENDVSQLNANTNIPTAENFSKPTVAENFTTKTLYGNTYSILTLENALELLVQGKSLENIYLENLALNLAQYTKRIVIKNSVLGSLELGVGMFQAPIQLEGVRIEKEVLLTQNSHFEDILIFNDCIFEKSLLLRGVNFPKGFSVANSQFFQNLSIENCIFQEESNFTRTTIENKFSLRQSQFSRTVRIQGSTWKNDTIFQLCQFNDGLKGDHLQFLGTFQIKECTFEGDFSLDSTSSKARVDLEKNSFYSNFRWNGSSFENKFVAKASIFKQNATICNDSFKNHFALPQSRFDGELALDGSEFHDRVFLQECLIENASWRGIVFHDFVDCEKIKFGGQFLCQGSTFKEGINFSYMETEGHGRISFNAIFEKNVDFYRATLRGAIWFLGCHFQDVSFVNTTFEGQVFFSFDAHTLRERNRRRGEGQREQSLTFLARFEGTANFTNTLFYRKAVFENIIFEKYANFENAYFAEEINFQKTHFKKGATFKGSFCTQELDFTRAVFDEYANFDLANINRRLNLTDAAIDQGISFYHAVIDVVVVERDQIEGRLIYEGKVKGQEDKRHYMRVKEEYLILKESFHQRGKFDEEDWAYHCYRVNDRKSYTDKAIRSLQNQPILAIQDDVPPEERENDQLLVKNAEKSLEKAEKNLESSQNRLKKQEDELVQAKESNIDRYKLKDIQNKIEDTKEKIKEQLETVEIRKRELNDMQKIVRLNFERQTKLHESRDKPFNKSQAIKCLFQNALWKLVDWGTGYGVKPFRLALLALVVIMIFASIYYLSGVMLPNHPAKLLKPCPQAHIFFDWVYFSAMTFATANLEGEFSFDERIQFFIMAESLIGIFLTALFVGCYTRKIIR